jgi:mannose-1-phosphate guanylyltransferase
MVVNRRWGYYKILAEKQGYIVKELTLLPEKSISLQYHNYRDEHWIILSGNGLVRIRDELFKAIPDSNFVIRRGEKHKIANTGKENLTLIEIQIGKILSEDDIIRFEKINETGL